MKIEEVADKTYRFETPLTGLERTLAVYFIKTEKPVLIDPGPTSAVPQIQEAMRQLGVKELAYVIPTHIHLDHAGSSGELIKLFPQATVIFHPSAVKHAIDPSRLIQGSKLAFGEDFEKLWGSIPAVPETKIKIAVDGEEIPIGDRSIKTVFAPGHAPHHIVVLDEKTGGLFSGEALGAVREGNQSYPVPAIVPPFDMETYIETAEKLAKLNPKLIFYAHGGVGKEPVELITRAIENTRTLGDVVLKALREGKSNEEAGRQLEKYIFEHAAIRPEIMEVPLMVEAYAYYFKRKGLI